MHLPGENLPASPVQLLPASAFHPVVVGTGREVEAGQSDRGEIGERGSEARQYEPGGQEVAQSHGMISRQASQVAKKGTVAVPGTAMREVAMEQVGVESLPGKKVEASGYPAEKADSSQQPERLGQSYPSNPPAKRPRAVTTGSGSSQSQGIAGAGPRSSAYQQVSRGGGERGGERGGRGATEKGSKVQTARGLRDRRIRLSAPAAVAFYDIQDRLGVNNPSAALEWLMQQARDAVAKLPPVVNLGHPRPSTVAQAVAHAQVAAALAAPAPSPAVLPLPLHRTGHAILPLESPHLIQPYPSIQPPLPILPPSPLASEYAGFRLPAEAPFVLAGLDEGDSGRGQIQPARREQIEPPHRQLGRLGEIGGKAGDRGGGLRLGEGGEGEGVRRGGGYPPTTPPPTPVPFGPEYPSHVIPSHVIPSHIIPSRAGEHMVGLPAGVSGGAGGGLFPWDAEYALLGTASREVEGLVTRHAGEGGARSVEGSGGMGIGERVGVSTRHGEAGGIEARGVGERGERAGEGFFWEERQGGVGSAEAATQLTKAEAAVGSTSHEGTSEFRREESSVRQVEVGRSREAGLGGRREVLRVEREGRVERERERGEVEGRRGLEREINIGREWVVEGREGALARGERGEGIEGGRIDTRARALLDRQERSLDVGPTAGLPHGDRSMARSMWAPSMALPHSHSPALTMQHHMAPYWPYSRYSAPLGGMPPYPWAHTGVTYPPPGWSAIPPEGSFHQHEYVREAMMVSGRRSERYGGQGLVPIRPRTQLDARGGEEEERGLRSASQREGGDEGDSLE